jgi:shikimate dehydrogenase
VITARTTVAGVAGSPVRHSLSPLLHNAWLKASGIDGVYVAFSPAGDGFGAFASGLRGAVVRGLNVTLPFKEAALALADEASEMARAAGAANLLLFHPEGRIEARNTDGEGMLGALIARAPGFDPAAGPALVMGAGGAARAATAALLQAGAPEVRVFNRTLERAERLVDSVAGSGGGQARAVADAQAGAEGAALVINATSLGLGGGPGPDVLWAAMARGAVAMDMVYRPLKTEFLDQAERHGLRPVDGLEMLIRQAIPSFEAFFGAPPPAVVDSRGLLLAQLEPLRAEGA